MEKKEVARILEEIALLLEFQNANPYKLRAYRKAAISILNYEGNLNALAAAGQLKTLDGIGERLAEKIHTLLSTGTLLFYEELKKTTPPSLLKMLTLRGVGVKTVKKFYQQLGITSIEQLQHACEQGLIAKLAGFGVKSQQNILTAIARRQTYQKRRLWWEAMAIATPILEQLKALKSVSQAEIAGSLRRKLETIGDLDFLAASSQPELVMDWFTSQPFVVQVLAKGYTKSSVLLENEMIADLRIVPEPQFGFALHYFTGSKEHNIKIRKHMLALGWSLSEWGLVLEEPGKPAPMLGGKKVVSEEDIYALLGMSYIPPELREDRGEIEAAKKGCLPILVEDRDILGSFHNHTIASDGRSSLYEMVEAAQKMGWEYIGIADHSKSSFQANGLSVERLLAQIEQIHQLNASGKFSTYIFTGIECDILPSGKLDLPDSVLKLLDYVLVSVHSALHLDKSSMTKRFIRAIENPYVTMIGHLSGRLLLQREAYQLDYPKVIEACIANGKMVEINSSPQRLDMDWRLWHTAAEKGLMCCINTDAHSSYHLEFYRAGVNVARKGWLTKAHVFNTRTLEEVTKILHAKKC